jgi:hypothetical protein
MARASARTMSVFDLERLIEAQRAQLRKLERLRSRYQRKLDALDRRIAALGGQDRRRGGRRPRNSVSLPEAIAKVLMRASSPLAVGDIAERVQASGYRSGAANFRAIVNQMLIKDRRFVSAERGVYCLRAAAQANGKARSVGRRKKRAAQKHPETGGAGTPT